VWVLFGNISICGFCVVGVSVVWMFWFIRWVWISLVLVKVVGDVMVISSL